MYPSPSNQSRSGAAGAVSAPAAASATLVTPLAGYPGPSFNRHDKRLRDIPPPHRGWDDAGWRAFFFSVNEAMGYMLIVLVALHIAGALKHQLINRDNLLARMLP